MKKYFEEAQNRTHYTFHIPDDDDKYVENYEKAA